LALPTWAAGPGPFPVIAGIQITKTQTIDLIQQIALDDIWWYRCIEDREVLAKQMTCAS